MLWSYNPNIDFDINLDLSFASNQTFNIFYLQILYILFSAFNLPYIDLDITSYTSTLAFSGEKVLYVLQSQGQPVCLIANLQKKITYRSVLFPSNGSRAKNVLQKKTTKGVTSKVIREITG